MKDRLIKKFEDEIQALNHELKLELPKEIKRARELGGEAVDRTTTRLQKTYETLVERGTADRVQIDHEPRLVGRQDDGPKRDSFACCKLFLGPHERSVGRWIKRTPMGPRIIDNHADRVTWFQA